MASLMKNQVDALIRELSAGQDDEVVGHVVELTSVLSDADRELLSSVVPLMEELLQALADRLEKGCPASLHSVAQTLLAASVALCRHGGAGMPSKAAMEATRCATSLAHSCLKAMNRAQYTGTTDLHTLEANWTRAKKIRRIFCSIAVAAIEGTCSDEEDCDPMSGLEVGRVFDAYSLSYDTAMIDLQYSVPDRVREWISSFGKEHKSSDSSKTHWQLVGISLPFSAQVDLGCGTGIMGRVMRGTCKELVGCDLSPGMALTAALLGLYDKVLIAECCDFLRNEVQPGAADVIIAADVVEYVGEVSGLFEAASQALEPGGYLIVSAESLEASSRLHGIEIECDTRFALLPTERFAHTARCLQDAARIAGLSAVQIERLPCLRLEESKPLQGWLCIAQKR